MRMRSTAMAVLVAAGLSVTLTGAAAAGEPDDDGPDVVIVTCEDGEPVVREPTDEERERLRALPAPPERARVERGERAEHRDHVVGPQGGAVRVVPPRPGEAPPDVACAVPGEPGGGPHVEVVPARPSAG
jgi:hypothetical protein